MKNVIAIFVPKSYLSRQTLLLLSLLGSLALGACTPAPTSTPTPTLTPISVPTIVSSRPCNGLVPGETIPLAVTGVPGTGVVYSWSASPGTVSPTDGMTVTYTAPNIGGDVFIQVVAAQKDGTTSQGRITCKVLTTPIPPPTVTDTPFPTLTYTPSPTVTIAPTPGQISPTPPCAGSTSEDLILKAWAGNPQTRLACTQLVIDRWTVDADREQASRLHASICTVTPNPHNTKAVQDFFTAYQALTDVATAWLLRGEALDDLDRETDAIEAYKTVIAKYSCGYALNNSGQFWNLAYIAQGKENEITP